MYSYHLKVETAVACKHYHIFILLLHELSVLKSELPMHTYRSEAGPVTRQQRVPLVGAWSPEPLALQLFAFAASTLPFATQ